MADRPDPKDVNPYDSKAYKRVKRKKRRKDPREVNPYDINDSKNIRKP